MRRLMAGAALALVLGGTAIAAIQEEAVTYKAGDTTMKGFIVYDDASKAKRPGVIVVHEWWGITRHIRDEARRFAGEGYTAFVADMYGDAKTADNPKDAGALSGAVRKDPAAMQARFNAARDALSKHATVDAARIGAAGYCFGGSVVLDMARVGTDLKGVAAFHAGLGAAGSQAAAGKVTSKVLVLNGEADPFIKPESVDAFKKEMAAASVDYRYINYPGAVHAFTNPEATDKGKQFNLPLAYHAEADKQSKAEASKFFRAAFAK
ncbi:MAG: dienelactone hydrolase family protein [Betaproteobacteria bacterium]|nr:dienelactone hydrolase family protein [Betaproteobacteria bacterium]MBK9605455.1 dienelactone hydrolase family protein [Betaproteobacteria bacterium]